MININDTVSYAYPFDNSKYTQIMSGVGTVISVVAVEDGARATFLVRVKKSSVHYEGQLVSVRPQHVRLVK